MGHFKSAQAYQESTNKAWNTKKNQLEYNYKHHPMVVNHFVALIKQFFISIVFFKIIRSIYPTTIFKKRILIIQINLIIRN